MGVLELGGQLGGAVLGTGMGMLFQGWQDERNYQNQKRLQALQIKGGKEMSDYQKAQQLDIWNKTNYEAQKEHLKAAGLNPALMYGQGGGGGATTGGGGAAMPSGGQAGGGDAGAMGLMNMAMMGAQTKVLESQARKNNVEADNAEGVDRTLKGTQTESIAQGITNQKTANELMMVQKRISEIDASYQGQSLEYRLDKIAQEANTALGQAQSAMANGNVDQETAKTKIDLIKQELVNKALESVAIDKGIQLSNSKINEIAQGIQQRWKEINVNETKSRYEHDDRVRAIEEYTSTTLKAAGIAAAGNVVRDVVSIATRKMPTGSISTTTHGMGETIRETWTRPNR